MGRGAYDTTGTPRPPPLPNTHTLCPGYWESMLWANAPLLRLRNGHRELTEAIAASSTSGDHRFPTGQTEKMPEDLQRVQRSFVRSLNTAAQTINTLSILDIPSVHSDALLEAFRCATSNNRICPDVDSAIITLQNSQDTGWRRSSRTSIASLPYWVVDPDYTIAVKRELESLCSTYSTCRELLKPWVPSAA